VRVPFRPRIAFACCRTGWPRRFLVPWLRNWIRPKLPWIWLVWCGCSVRLGIRSGLGIACEGNVRWADDTSLSDPLLGCEIYLFSFFWETFELHRAEFLPCSAQFKDSLRSPCLSSPFLSTAVLVAGEGWSLSRLQVGMPVAVAVSLLGSADAFGLGVCSVRELSIDVMALIICSPF
jgi:hypothetical protein